jgi:hypothetical protein
MADRYLIGTGSRNWNDTANWSTTSGGSGGASVPTSADNVFIDNNSGTGTITVNAIVNMLDLTFGTISAITISNAAYAFNVYGNLTLPASNLTVSFTGTGYFYLKATTSVNVTMGATTGRSFNRIYFDGVGGIWTNQDEMNTSAAIYFANGTWITNNNTITIGSYNTIAGTKTLTLGSSTLYLVNYEPSNGASTLPYTLNAGTSTIYCSADFYGSGKTFYNVILTGPDLRSLRGSNTYNNLSIIPSSGTVTATRNISENHTINGLLTITGFNSLNNRILIASNTIGTARTITCNGTITASNVDFRDITGAGSASWDLSAITGGSGDCGGNSGITFTAAQKQYFKHTSGAVNFSDSTKWFSDFSPRTTAGRVPLPQDDWDMDANSFTGTSTVSVNCPRIGKSCDMSGVNQAVTWSLANAIECYGSYILGNNITPSGNYLVTLMGRGNFNLNLYGKTIYGLTSNAYSGIYTNLSSITSQNSVSILAGTFYFNNFNVTASILSVDFEGNSNVYMGSGIFLTTRLSGNVIYITTSGIVDMGTSTIIISPSSGSGNVINNDSRTNKTYNKVQFSGSHTGNFDITGNNTFAELIIDAGRKVRFMAGTTQNIAKLTATGTAGNLITITSPTAAQHTLNYTGVGVVSCDYLNLSYSKANQTNTFYAGTHSTDGGNNTNWLFISPVTGKKWNGVTITKWNGVSVSKINGL